MDFLPVPSHKHPPPFTSNHSTYLLIGDLLILVSLYNEKEPNSSFVLNPSRLNLTLLIDKPTSPSVKSFRRPHSTYSKNQKPCPPNPSFNNLCLNNSRITSKYSPTALEVTLVSEQPSGFHPCLVTLHSPSPPSRQYFRQNK